MAEYEDRQTSKKKNSRSSCCLIKPQTLCQLISRGIFHAELFINLVVVHILPDPEPFLIGDARGPVPDTKAASLGVGYWTPRHCICFLALSPSPVPDPYTTGLRVRYRTPRY